MKEAQADIKRLTAAVNGHTNEFLKVDQTLETMQALLQGHNDHFLKVEQTLETIQLLLRQQVESSKSHSNCHDGANSTEATYQPISSILQHPRIMKVEFPKFSGDEAMQWIYKAERFSNNNPRKNHHQ